MNKPFYDLCQFKRLHWSFLRYYMTANRWIYEPLQLQIFSSQNILLIPLHTASNRNLEKNGWKRSSISITKMESTVQPQKYIVNSVCYYKYCLFDGDKNCRMISIHWEDVEIAYSEKLYSKYWIPYLVEWGHHDVLINAWNNVWKFVF